MRHALERPLATAATEAYAELPRPLFTRLPVDYRIVPLRLRAAVLRFLARARPVAPRFPAWPIETSLDESLAGSFPGPHRAALLLTHDVDTAGELELIAAIRAIERDVGLVSAWGFVPGSSWPTEERVRSLVAEGCEVYWHDVRHDGRLAYLPLDRIRSEFARVEEASPWAGELMRSFRSGQLLMSANLMTAVRERFDVDLSVPDTERDGPYGGTAGCGTVIPFLMGRCLEIPLSLPQDVFLRHVHGLTADEALRLWQRKVGHIAAVGGVAVLNTHPIWVNPDRPDMWDTYRAFLDWAVERGDLLVTTPSEVRRLLLDGDPPSTVSASRSSVPA